MVYVLLGTGFEEVEAVAPVDLMRRAGIPVLTVGINGKTVFGGHGIGVASDIEIGEMGLGGVASVRACPEAMNALDFAWKNGKFVAAICAGPTVLADLDITDGKTVTCYPGCESGMGSANCLPDQAVIRDGNLITGTSAGCAIPFGLALIEALKDTKTANTVAGSIVIR